MSILKFLKTENCPICGSIAVQDSIKTTVRFDPLYKNEVLTHCSGGRPEERAFLCGFHLEYSPNFEREIPVTGYKCQNDPELLAESEKRLKFMESLIGLVEKSKDIDNAFREVVVDRLDSALYPLRRRNR